MGGLPLANFPAQGTLQLRDPMSAPVRHWDWTRNFLFGMWQKPHREFEREARLLSKLKQWFEQPKGDPAMFPLSLTCVKIAAAGALMK